MGGGGEGLRGKEALGGAQEAYAGKKSFIWPTSVFIQLYAVNLGIFLSSFDTMACE